MLSKLSNEQLTQIALCATQITGILAEICLPHERAGIKRESDFDPPFEIFVVESDGEDRPCKESTTQSVIKDFVESDRLRREQAMNRLCGRWMAGNNRCGIEISRRGEHFILTYLKRNGRPSDERYILIWLDGDILYYGNCDRITVVALDTESDTLMLSPGVNYTRISEIEKK